jgi:hypothetical protein
MSVRRSVYSLLIGTVVVVLLAVPSRSQEAPSAAPLDIPFFSQTALRGQTDTQYMDYPLGYCLYPIGQAEEGGLKCYKS